MAPVEGIKCPYPEGKLHTLFVEWRQKRTHILGMIGNDADADEIRKMDANSRMKVINLK
jgi:hypothetical protein